MNVATVILSIIEQHAEEAAFLWFLHGKAVHAPHYLLKDLAKLDDRVEAHIDGLRTAGDAGWEICKEALETGEGGEVFTAAVLAFESGDEARIQTVLDAGSKDAGLSRGIVSALGWMPYEQAAKHIRQLVAADTPDLRHIGIVSSANHRRNPDKALIDAISDTDLRLRARALKAVGQLGRTDLLALLWNNLTEEDDTCRFFAAWSAAILGDRGAVAVLMSFVQPGLPHCEEALNAAIRRMDMTSSLDLWQELAGKPDSIRLAVVCAGIIGDPVLIPWLMEQMTVPELARVAGESFTMIADVDIAYEDLEGERPEGFEAGPTENPEDEDVEMDPDEDLPWPNPELILNWWNKNKGRFKNGTRYLVGQSISPENLQQVLRTGFQRQRAAAALELSIMKPGQPLFEVRAPGFRQKKLLGVK